MAGLPSIDELVELPEGAFLDEASSVETTCRRHELQKLRMAYVWAVRHPKERLDPREIEWPGREQAKRYGGPGTPLVGEFAAASLGARLGLSPAAARVLMGDALDLVHRMPLLWARVDALEVKASYARFVTKRCRELTAEQARSVDRRVVESADGRISWSRFEALVEAAVVASDLDAAREAEQHAAKTTFAKRTRADRHGMATFVIRADAATIEVIDQTVAAVAKRLDDSAGETVDQRRVSAVLLLARGRDGLDEQGEAAPVDVAGLLPTVTLFVHAYRGTLDAPGEGIVRIQRPDGTDHAVTEDWLRRFLGPRARFAVQPVLDIEGQAPVDAYEIPDRHRRAVRLMTPADTFPFASCRSGRMQVDHTIAWDEHGPSAIGNYGPMTTFHHRLKTHAGWQVQQPFPGIFVWRDPHGQAYLVDHTGTRALRKPRQPSAGEARWRRLLDLAA
ncbi:hypothetical protein [Nocardioides sp. CER19]|uniref:hypothetical protein n=1 Tax=Nocardioides sp. CER19 TaxID=3038538 RepID=UPI00244B10DF|nr:hypothetical protein [Nocardioides sp. CER19]MDH2414987.1 hypothetical protein [Nocardioides sp. CER19]